MKRVTSVDVHVGKKLKLRRINLGLSQQELGKMLKITFQQVQKYEKGVNRVSCGKLYQLSNVLDVPLTYFFDGLEGSNDNSSRVSNCKDVDYEDLNKEILTISRLLNKVSDKKKKKNLVETIKNLIKFLKEE